MWFVTDVMTCGNVMGQGYGMTIAGVGGSGGSGPCGKNFTIVGNTFIGGNVTPIVLDQVGGLRFELAFPLSVHQ